MLSMYMYLLVFTVCVTLGTCVTAALMILCMVPCIVVKSKTDMFKKKKSIARRSIG